MSTHEFDVLIRYSTTITVSAEEIDDAIDKALDHFNNTKITIDGNERTFCEVVGVKRID